MDSSDITQQTTEFDARDLMRTLSRYQEPSSARSIVELAITATPLGLVWILMWTALDSGLLWLYAGFILPGAGFLVRLFIIQHDCGHGSFFRRRLLNDWVGRAISVLTLTPYDHWRHTHGLHHASSGNLSRRGTGDVHTLTVHEYAALSPWRRIRYRVYRHPISMFGLGPSWLFLFENRLPLGFMRGKWRPWISTMSTNLAIVIFIGLMAWAVGVGPFLAVHVPITLLAATIGTWMFYVQHQFEETEWADGPNWNQHKTALHGSSHYDLPIVLRWFTGNIGVHHVHHLCSRIPFYRLPLVLRDHPELRHVGRLNLLQSLGCASLALWDERQQRLISFREMHSRQP